MPQIYNLPDLGDGATGEVIEWLIQPGDSFLGEQPLVVIEADKATVEIPAPMAGTLTTVLATVGDEVGPDSPLMEYETETPAAETTETETVTVAAAGPQAATDTRDAVKDPSPPSSSSEGSSSSEPVTFNLPDFGEGASGELTQWLVAVGDSFSEEDYLAVVEADKATVDIPATVSGTVVSLLVNVGDEVGNATPLLTYTQSKDASSAKAIQVDSTPRSKSVSAASPTPLPAPDTSAPTPLTPAGGEVYAGPATRRLARKLGVDLRKVPPTGRRGRVCVEDVEKWVRTSLAAKSGPAVGFSADTKPLDSKNYKPHQRVALTRFQKVIARRMAQDWPIVPQVTQHDMAQMDALMSKRASLLAQEEGSKISPLYFVLAAAVAVAKMRELMRTLYDSASQEVLVFDRIDVGLAVDSPKGLVVPVLQDLGSATVSEIAAQATGLIEKARQNKLTAAEQANGTFTVSSLGALGGRGFSPLVSAPQPLIFGLGRMHKGVVVETNEQGVDQMVVRQLLPISISYDHRCINGAQAGEILTDLCTEIQTFKQN